jgi:hypothetical protein
VHALTLRPSAFPFLFLAPPAAAFSKPGSSFALVVRMFWRKDVHHVVQNYLRGFTEDDGTRMVALESPTSLHLGGNTWAIVGRLASEDRRAIMSAMVVDSEHGDTVAFLSIGPATEEAAAAALVRELARSARFSRPGAQDVAARLAGQYWRGDSYSSGAGFGGGGYSSEGRLLLASDGRYSMCSNSSVSVSSTFGDVSGFSGSSSSSEGRWLAVGEGNEGVLIFDEDGGGTVQSVFSIAPGERGTVIVEGTRWHRAGSA